MFFLYFYDNIHAHKGKIYYFWRNKMAGYLELAETIIFKRNRLSVINAYNELSAIAMPAEFVFDMVVMCGPNWTEGDHKLTVKVKANENGEELSIAEATVKIPHNNFVYNAIANDVKFTMNYDVQYLTFTAYDNDKAVISRVYPVRAMLVPQSMLQKEEKEEVKK